jgi:hypothetical protein
MIIVESFQLCFEEQLKGFFPTGYQYGVFTFFNLINGCLEIARLRDGHSAALSAGLARGFVLD